MTVQEQLHVQLTITECICAVLESPCDVQICINTAIPALFEPNDSHVEYLIRKGTDTEVYDKWFMSCNDGDSHEFEDWQDIVNFVVKLADACQTLPTIYAEGQ
jgi:hypothetical protein